jgi:hypothetical protein
MHNQFSGTGNGYLAAAYPKARAEGLTIEEGDGEALIYDNARHEIHHLNPTVLAIWRLSDGFRAPHQISTAASLQLGAVVDDQAVKMAWTLLGDRHLLLEPLAPGMRVTARRSRRSFLKGALVTGTAALPTIVSVSAPKAAAAASQGCGLRSHNCSISNPCCPEFYCTDLFLNGFCTI